MVVMTFLPSRTFSCECFAFAQHSSWSTRVGHVDAEVIKGDWDSIKLIGLVMRVCSKSVEGSWKTDLKWWPSFVALHCLHPKTASMTSPEQWKRLGSVLQSREAGRPVSGRYALPGPRQTATCTFSCDSSKQLSEQPPEVRG